MIRVTRLPIRKDQHARTQFTDDTRDLDPIAEGVLDAAIGDVERLAPTDFQDARRLAGLARAVFNGAARAHFALREVEDSSAVSALAHLEQRTAARLFHIVAMSGDGQNVAMWRVRHQGYSRSATATPSRSGTSVVNQSFDE